MIVKELYTTREDGVKLFRTYSDRNRYIKKVGTTEIYSEAVDVEDAPYEYVETDKVIENIENIEDYGTDTHA
jgi:hypothetical protein